MSTVTFTSKCGMTVTLPESEAQSIINANGPVKGRELILTYAGAALKRRRELEAFASQSVSPEVMAEATYLAKAAHIQSETWHYACELGYGEYVNRVSAGRHVNQEQFARIMERTSRTYSDALAALDHYKPTPAEIQVALGEMGYLTEFDAEYCRARGLRPAWEITVPAGWDGQQ